MTESLLSRGIEILSITLTLVGTIIFLAYLAKKFNLPKMSGQRGFNILSQQKIGPREKMLLVNFDGKMLLVGVVPGAINLLAETENKNVEIKNKPFAKILQKEQAG